MVAAGLRARGAPGVLACSTRDEACMISAALAPGCDQIYFLILSVMLVMPAGSLWVDLLPL